MQIIRRKLYPKLDPLMRKLGLYSSYTLDEREFVKETDLVPQQVIDKLYHGGYEGAGFTSAAKRHPETGEIDVASMRRVYPDNPRWQWHVHLFRRDGKSEVYSHYELRPDFRRIDGESLQEVVERLKEHYRPNWSDRRGGGTYIVGDYDEVVEDL